MKRCRAEAIRQLAFGRRRGGFHPPCVIVALMMLAGCAAIEGQPAEPGRQYESLAAPTPSDVAMTITQADDGNNITVKVSTKIAVELIGVPTAGYMWTITEKPAFLEAAGEYGGPTSSAQLEPGFAGGSHWEAFAFMVTAAGEGVLRFEQRRAWKSDEPAADEFSIYLFAEE